MLDLVMNQMGVGTDFVRIANPGLALQTAQKLLRFAYSDGDKIGAIREASTGIVCAAQCVLDAAMTYQEAQTVGKSLAAIARVTFSQLCEVTLKRLGLARAAKVATGMVPDEVTDRNLIRSWVLENRI